MKGASEITGGPRPPRYPYVVAVLGARDLLDVERLARLIQLLVNRRRDDHNICLISAGPDSPELGWAHDLGWSIIFEPRCGNRVKQDCGIVKCADAVIVLGDPAPWQRLLKLAREAKIPTRVYEHAPRLPATREYPTEV